MRTSVWALVLWCTAVAGVSSPAAAQPEPAEGGPAGGSLCRAFLEQARTGPFLVYEQVQDEGSGMVAKPLYDLGPSADSAARRAGAHGAWDSPAMFEPRQTT